MCTWEVPTWEMSTWEVPAWKVPTWEVPAWEVPTWEVPTWVTQADDPAHCPLSSAQAVVNLPPQIGFRLFQDFSIPRMARTEHAPDWLQ